MVPGLSTISGSAMTNSFLSDQKKPSSGFSFGGFGSSNTASTTTKSTGFSFGGFGSSSSTTGNSNTLATTANKPLTTQPSSTETSNEVINYKKYLEPYKAKLLRLLPFLTYEIHFNLVKNLKFTLDKAITKVFTLGKYGYLRVPSGF